MLAAPRGTADTTASIRSEAFRQSPCAVRERDDAAPCARRKHLSGGASRGGAIADSSEANPHILSAGRNAWQRCSVRRGESLGMCLQSSGIGPGWRTIHSSSSSLANEFLAVKACVCLVCEPSRRCVPASERARSQRAAACTSQIAPTPHTTPYFARSRPRAAPSSRTNNRLRSRDRSHYRARLCNTAPHLDTTHSAGSAVNKTRKICACGTAVSGKPHNHVRFEPDRPIRARALARPCTGWRCSRRSHSNLGWMRGVARSSGVHSGWGAHSIRCVVACQFWPIMDPIR